MTHLLRSQPRGTRRTDDVGSVLPIVLVLVIVFGALAAAIATYASTALSSTKVTTNIVDRLASAESGAQLTLASVDAGSCPPTINHGLINGAGVTSTCDFVFRLDSADAKFALVVTGKNVDSSFAFDTRGANSVPNADRKISGPIYLGDGVTADLVQTSALLFDSDTGITAGGDVRYDVPADCTGFGSLDGPVLPSDFKAPFPVVSCDSRGWEIVAPPPDLSGFPTPPLPAIGDAMYGTCRVFTPGMMSSTSLTITEDAFFTSGVYYFEDVSITIGNSASNHVMAGRRAGFPAPAAPYPAACASTAAYGGDPGTGALFIMAGNSTILFDKTFSTFYPIEFDGDIYSLIALDVAADGYDPATLDPDTTRMVDRQNPPQTNYAFHGRVYAPGSWLDTGNAATSSVEVEFSGGLVAARVTVQTAAKVDGFNISVPTNLAEFYLIESTAVNDGSTTVRVTAKDLEPGTEVLTWRVCSTTGC